ncbi:Uncharacterised protein [Mycobacteroides abscessus subsp. abscessus]|nr:Uncharacterised protein [Mycobacteroides abscessus subsp. abscessus]
MRSSLVSAEIRPGDCRRLTISATPKTMPTPRRLIMRSAEWASPAERAFPAERSGDLRCRVIRCVIVRCEVRSLVVGVLA